MILPNSFGAGIALLIVSLLCWGMWPGTFKRAGKWRYELYYLDFSIGFLVFSAVAAFTLGMLNSSELTFSENFLITGYRKMAYAIAAGVLFNIANLLLTGGIASAGMAAAFVMSLGTAMTVGVIWDFVQLPEANAMLMFGGAVLVLAAIAAMAMAHSGFKEAVFLASKKVAMQVDPRSKQGKKTPQSSGALLGIIISVVSGILFGFFPPLMTLATDGENGVAPYGAVLLTAVGIMGCTFVASPFIINFPIGGSPVRIGDYFRSKVSQHMLGWMGGAMLCGGLLAGMVVAGSPARILVGPVWSYACGHAAPLVAFALGLMVWSEFRSAPHRVRNFLMASAVLFAAGVVMVSVAPLYSGK
ncbi:MAG: hypothetical protein ABL967_19285 [Bryobacteraceae bacterium]